jgi:hypothetical protein
VFGWQPFTFQLNVLTQSFADVTLLLTERAAALFQFFSLALLEQTNFPLFTVAVVVAGKFIKHLLYVLKFFTFVVYAVSLFCDAL